MLRNPLARISFFHNTDRSHSNELNGEEFKLPKTTSLVIIITYNIMLQVSFFIIISSSSKYVEHLSGSATFAGLVIGIPTLFSSLILFPMTKYDKALICVVGRYATALHIGCFTGFLGQLAYATAYHANFLYLILIGRILSGLSFSGFMYCKRYCTDPSIVGIRRRTTLSSWLVIGQALGMTLGPFLGGALYKIGFQSTIYNGYTSPGWIMAFCHLIFWLVVAKFFQDVPTPEMNTDSEAHELTTTLGEQMPNGDLAMLPHPTQTSASPSLPPQYPFIAQLSHITLPQWEAIICMCWFSLLCFFVLASWEANLPIFGAANSTLNWSPFSAGNFIGLVGIATFPFFLANLAYARRIQDRHLLAFGIGLGLCGLVVFISLLATSKITYASIFLCWWSIALGFNLSTTVTLSLLSKQLPAEWTKSNSMAIQYSIYIGRLTGAIWGGSGVAIGMLRFVGLEIGLVGIGGLLFMTLWRNLKAKTG